MCLADEEQEGNPLDFSVIAGKAHREEPFGV
jgi:hypothetical protein